MIPRILTSSACRAGAWGWCLAAAAGFLPAVQVQAQERAVTAARAEAIVVTRLSLIKTEDLEFGKIIAGNTAGTVRITPAGVRTATGGVRLANGDSHPAAFSGYGYRNQNVGIWLSSSPIRLTRVGGIERMTIDTFVIGSTPQATITTSPSSFRIASADGMFAFPLGATLRVGARQVPGVYRGSFTLMIQYY